MKINYEFGSDTTLNDDNFNMHLAAAIVDKVLMKDRGDDKTDTDNLNESLDDISEISYYLNNFVESKNSRRRPYRVAYGRQTNEF